MGQAFPQVEVLLELRSDLSDKQSGAGDRDRTGMASLEGWGSTIELHPQLLREAERTGCVTECKKLL